MSRVENTFQFLAADKEIEMVEFFYEVKDRNFEPVRGESLHMSIEGNGTFEMGLQAKEQDTKTDEDGKASATWIEEKNETRQDLNFTIGASCEAENSEISMCWSLPFPCPSK